MVELNEWVNMINILVEKRSEDNDLKEKFAKFDLAKDGKISAEELQKAMETMGEQCTEDDVKKMIYSVDLSGDGKLNTEGRL